MGLIFPNTKVIKNFLNNGDNCFKQKHIVTTLSVVGTEVFSEFLFPSFWALSSLLDSS